MTPIEEIREAVKVLRETATEWVNQDYKPLRVARALLKRGAS